MEDAVFEPVLSHARHDGADGHWARLQSLLSGDIVLPGHPRYMVERRLFNLAFDPNPLAIVHCRTEEDVRECLRFVVDAGLGFTIRSGGHTTAGYSSSDGRVVLDVSALNGVSVDAAARTAVAGTGTPFEKLNKALHAHGLHVPGGECDSVCIGGFVQGGGYGFTSRTFGMNCDNVLSMRVMLADGSLVVASREEHADLLWAMCGGTGCNFGVLLSVEYRLQVLPELCGWALAWPLETPADRANASQALQVLQRQYMKTGAPKELNSQVMLCCQTPDDDYSKLKQWLLIRGTYVGPQAEAEGLLGPLASVPGVVRQYVMAAPYVTVNAALLSQPHKVPQFPPIIGKPKQRKRARYVARDLELGEWRALLDHFATCPNRLSYMCIEVYGGAINAAPHDLNAFIHRDVAFSVSLGVFWTDEHDEKHAALRFIDEWCAVVEPYWNGHIYQNYPSPDAPDYRRNYWGPAYPRLQAIKAKYDPRNVFQFAQSIEPAATP